MAKERISRPMKDQIIALRQQGLSIRAIAASLKIHRHTVRKYLPQGDRHKVECSVEVCAVSWEQAVDWTLVDAEIRRGTTIKQLFKENAPDGVGYVAFWRACRSRVPHLPEPVIRLSHKPGQKTQVDYADGIDIVDRQTGETMTTELFCGVLPFSNYTFGEFVLSQKSESFLSSHKNMFAYFGGATPYVIVDNLKSGVVKAHLYDPDVNAAYCEFGNHYGFAVLPARPREPHDKSAVECVIGILQKTFYQEVRNQTFYSLAELNAAFKAFLKEFNAAIMKDYGISRNERFAVEKPLLKALPANEFEICRWRLSKVHPDCHIQVEKNFYSVPFPHVGKSVRVRLTQKMVEVFDEDGEAITAHPRINGRHRFATNPAHYPDTKLSVVSFDVSQAKKQASLIGVHTQELVEKLFETSHPLKYLRRAQGLIRLAHSGQVPLTSIEYAAQMALKFKNMRLDYIKSLALHHHRHGAKPVLTSPERDLDTLHLHAERKLS